jgi:3-oxoacyl-[acyl-carrier protein] reductase
MFLEDKVAIVTGASRGIGKAIAIKLAREGANIIVNYAGNSQGAEEVVNTIKDMGRQSYAFQANVASAEDVEAMVKFTIEKFSKIDILVNNAGITKDTLLMRMKEEDWDAVLDINLKGTFLCTKAVTKVMMKQRAGKIVNISSVVGFMGNPGQSNYTAAKAGMIGFTKTVARELGSRGITANAVAPGFIETDMTHTLTDEVKSKLKEQIPLGKMGSSEDIANAVTFLVSEAANYITGQTIHVNGGMIME